MINQSFRLYKIQLLVLFAICLLGYLASAYNHHFKGMGIGLAVGFYCMWLLARKIEKITENAVKGEKKFLSLGMATRATAVILGAMLMNQLGHNLIMWTFATGVLVGYFLFIINLAYYSYNSAKEE